MIKNYLKTALRNLWREKGSTLINLAGLTLGITSSLVLFLLIRHHSGYDHYHSKFERTYRIVAESDGNAGRRYTPGVPPVLPEAFRNDFPEAEEVTFTSYRWTSLITIPQAVGEPKKYAENKGVTFAEPGFFNIFDRKILIGNSGKGLDDPNEAIISRKSALKYFGKEDAIGEILKFDNQEYRITAVMEDYPPNTDFPFDVMLSYATIRKEHEKQGWGGIWSDEQCYFTLKENADIRTIESRMPEFYRKYHAKENRTHQSFSVQPLREIHFDDRYGNYNYNTISERMLVALTIIAIFLMLTACINFINLTTAEAIKRSKEVGIRKSLGSTRSQLIFQFLGETSLVTVVSVVVALGCTQLVLGFLNPFLGIQLSLQFLSGTLWVFLATLIVVVAVLSGLYPSFVVSGFKAVEALKNNIANKNSSGYTLRRVLVVFQFFVSQLLIIGTLVLIEQMDYFQKTDLGFQHDAVVVVPIPENETPDTEKHISKMRTLREELSGISSIEMASLSSTPPASGSISNTDFTLEGSSENYATQVKLTDGNYFKLYGLELVAGNNLLDLDTAQGFVVNERLASTAGYTHAQEIIGKKMKLGGKELPIVGVVRNFHTVSLHDPIEATVMFNRMRSYETLSLRLNPAHLKETIKVVRQKWEAAYPDFVFSYQFLDEQIREFYEQENKNSVLLSIFTSMAIFIGCLGLFGLATFITHQKTKEIGVRKVLGASVESIVIMFSTEYVKLIVAGFVLAAPLAWYAMSSWLDEFAYKIELGPAVFLIGLVVTLVIAVVTVGYRSFEAARINPAQSLKSE